MNKIKRFQKFKKRKRFKKLKNKKFPKSQLLLNYKLIIVIVFLLSLYLMYKIIPIKTKNNSIIKISNKKINIEKINIENITNTFNYSLKYDEFDETINEQYLQLQNKFCEKENESLISEFEKRIIKAHANYSGKDFDMFVHTGKDLVSQSILSSHKWEGKISKKCLTALEYYSRKRNIKNEDIYLLDIGCNVGWYTFFLGKYGYKIISFEVWEVNNYILYKNYCLNKDINVTLINKGLDAEDKKCTFKTSKGNKGNGMIFCENRDKYRSDLDGETFNNVELTKLSRYYNYLSNKNLALIKMDVEGSEANVFEGGKELITKYHVPFIKIEYEQSFLEAHGTKVLEFLQFFENNGYKISLYDFLSKHYISISEIIKNKNILNLFIVYEKFLD